MNVGNRAPTARIERPPTTAMLATGLAVATLALAGQLRDGPSRPPTAEAILHVAGGLSFLLVGIYAWRRRPDNRTGALMTAVGFAWFITDLRWTESSVAITLAGLTDTYYVAILGHLAIAFPSGRLTGRLEQRAAAVIYSWPLLGNLATHVVLAPAAPACSCVHDLLVFHRDPGLNDVASHVQNVINILLVLMVLVIFLRHRMTATRLGRRGLDPVLWASGPIVVAIVALNAVNVVAPLHGLSSALPTLTPLALMTLPFTFLAGQLRSSLARLALGDLVVELGRPLVPGQLRDLLARTFGDPTLEIAYWLPDTRIHVDAGGNVISLPTGSEHRSVTSLEAGGEPAALLIHDASLDEDPELIRSVTAAARLAIENERLQAEVRAQLVEVRASRMRIVEASDEARRRLERDLHDGAQQRLVSLSLTIQRARAAAGAASSPTLCVSLDEAATELTVAIQELRQLAAGIHPAILTQGGLEAALEDLAERAPLPATVSVSVDGGLSPSVDATAYFVVSEALTNAGKHARARSISITVAHRDRHLVIDIADDGVGGADQARGSGLRGLADRLAALDGRLEIESPQGGGTRITAEIPCD